MKLRLLPPSLTRRHDPTPLPPVFAGSIQDLPASKTTSGEFDSERIPSQIFSKLYTALSGERIEIDEDTKAFYLYDASDNEVVKIATAIWTTTPGIHVTNGVVYLTGTSGEENIQTHDSIHLYEDYNDVTITKNGIVITSDTTDTHNVIHIKKFNGGGYDDIVTIDADGNTLIAGTISGDVTGALTGNADTATTAGKVANALTAGTGLTSAGTFDGAATRTFAVDLGTGATQAAYGNHVQTTTAGGTGLTTGFPATGYGGALVYSGSSYFFVNVELVLGNVGKSLQVINNGGVYELAFA